MGRYAVISIIATSCCLNADVPYAIIGGRDHTSTLPFAAFISSSGTSTIINTGSTGNGFILSVAINSSGTAIIGGQDHTNTLPFAAFISPSGTSTIINTGSTGNGIIKSVAIDSSGAAIIGGQDHATANPFAAVISPSGVVTTLTNAGATGTGNIGGVAINSSGTAIIGGRDHTNTLAFAAFVSSSGIPTIINTGSTGQGLINSVAINSSGAAIIGGQDHSGSQLAFAAFISPSGTPTIINTGATGISQILHVAINDSKAAVIGGIDHVFVAPFAAVISPSGVVTTLTNAGATGNGGINGVAINSSGVAIIGGTDNGSTLPFAAFISPSGTPTIINIGATGNGTIGSVAINSSGAAIIGGRDHTNTLPFAALISPSGVSTIINIGSTGTGNISGVDIQTGANNGPAILNLVVPTSFGAGNSYANSLFPLTDNLLPNHLMNALETNPQENQSLTAGTIPSQSCCMRKASYCLWTSLFGAEASQGQVQQTPKAKDWAGGAIVAFDYQLDQEERGKFCVGGGAAYAFNYVHLSGVGHAKINQELVTAYGAYKRNYLFLDAALWGGIYQTVNDRHTLDIITSKSHYRGWLLIPHLEISTTFDVRIKENRCLTLSPFAMIDWANNWQGHIKERGRSGFNLVMGSQYVSLLRSEAGFRLFQNFSYQWGYCSLQEKFSYVNKVPFGSQSTSTFFVGSISSFSIETFGSNVQNLGSFQCIARFSPYNKNYPYGNLNYQGEFGAHFVSNVLSVEIGKDF